MKILVYGINYAPELTGIGKYTAEMATWLAAAGHDVRVVSAPPYYPNWAVWPGWKASRYAWEEIKGVRVLRTPLWVPTKVTGVTRIIHLASFAICSAPALLAQWRWKPDAVWMTEPPLLCTPGALVFARLRGTRTWLHVQDFEVDAAFELGLLRGRLLRSIVLGVERWLMRAFDRVSSISGRMVDRARHKGVAPERLKLLPNWADITAIQPLQRPSRYRADLSIGEHELVALYSGNMGAKQGLEILPELARQLPELTFVFCGNGPGRQELALRCADLRNVRLLDLQPVEQLGELLGLADIHLLPQRADAADLVMPSKLTGMLSSGRPVVAGAHPDTELGRVVVQCGLLAAPENIDAFASAIRRLAGDADLRRRLGAQAREFAESRIARDAVLARFEKELEACITGGP